MALDAVLWLAKPLPEKNWGEKLDLIVGILGAVIMAVVVIWMVVSTVRSYRRNRFCPSCRIKMVMGWRTEKRGFSNPRVRISGKGIKFSTGVDKIAVLRCPKCGREIDLGK